MNVYSKEFSISSYDLNPSGKARLTTMAHFFQELAYHHASQLGFGYQDMKERQTTWVLSRMRIRMDRYPAWDERIFMETWPSGVDKLFALRDFRIKDAAGKLMGVASTAWLILDLDTHRLIRPKEALEHFKLIVHAEQVFEDPLDKIELPEETRSLHSRAVAYSDLDIVGHVNNVKYIEWCIDSVTTRSDPEQEIREFEINFSQEALLGDEIEIRGQTLNKEQTIFLARRKGDGKEIIRARMIRISG
jgi:medium-chain acyl-[acyl-carrier-protein] hydrolase